MRASSILQVLRDNYAPHEAQGNVLAFEWGRRAAHDLPRVLRLIQGSTPVPAHGLDTVEGGESVRGRGAIERVVAERVRRLTAFQDAKYAERYRALVQAVREVEEEMVQGQGQARAHSWIGHVDRGEVEGGGTGDGGEEEGMPLTAAVARYYFKVLAYKDEIEVSRLHLEHGPTVLTRVWGLEFGCRVGEGLGFGGWG